MKYLITIILIFTFCTSFASEQDINALQKHQKQLENMLNKFDEMAKQRTQHHQALTIIEKKLKCHWTLIQSYEICEKLYEKNAQDYLVCISKAKNNSFKCLNLEPDSTPVTLPGK